MTVRHYTSYAGSKYLLPADDEERERLTRQHYMIKGFFGGNLLAPVKLRGLDKVLECATGSGAWLLDIAHTLPKSVTLWGTDIEPQMFPPKHEVPENVKFSVASILDLPSEWSGQFKLVNLRFVVFGLQRNEWPVAIREMYRVVAPGGWLQITELGDWNLGPITKRHKQLIVSLGDSRNLMIDCAKHIPSMLSDSGFINIRMQSVFTPMGKWAGESGDALAKNTHRVFDAMKAPTLAGGGFGIVNTAEDYDMLLEEMHREWDETPGPNNGINWHTFYAQKKDI